MPRGERAGRRAGGVVVLLGLLSLALVAPARAQVVTRPAVWGYPGFSYDVAESCILRLDGSVAGWVDLQATAVTPAAGIRIDNGRLLGLSGPRFWLASDQSQLEDEPQAYVLWDGGSTGRMRAARIEPGERFRVAYTLHPTDGGRALPPGSQRIDTRVIDEQGHALPLVEESCGWDATAVRGGLPGTQRTIDWAHALADQNAAIAAGLVLPPGWPEEFLRVLHGVCQFDAYLAPPDDIPGATMLEVDHGAAVTVGVLGDSVTSQIRDELVADTRYNWVVASLCGARLDHFLGDPLSPSDPDLEFALDAILAADPDVVVVALGSVDSRISGHDNKVNIQQMLDRLAPVRCPVWMNAFVGTNSPSWTEGVRRFNAQLATAAADRGVPILDWQGVVTASGLGDDDPWLAPGPFDQLHVSVPTGHQARVGLTLAAIDTCAAPPPPPSTCVSGLWDITGTHTFCEEISWLVQAGITTGYADFTFHPNGSVTRASMAAFLHRLSGSPPLTPPASPTFPDVGLDHPFFAEIEWLVGQGVATGFPDGSFGPGLPVSRQSMATFLYRLAGSPPFADPPVPSFTDVPANDPFFTEIEWLAAQGVTTGFADGSYRPANPVARQGMAAFLQRYAALG